MAHNVQMPFFSAASGSNAQSSWGDVDNLDVDMLAEYLLGDGSLNASGVTFDFALDGSNHGSNVVSPENSEDGNFPLVADVSRTEVAFQQAPSAFQQAPSAFQQAPIAFQQAPIAYQQAVPRAHQQAPVAFAAQLNSQQISSQGILQGAQLAPLPTGVVYNSLGMPQIQNLGMLFPQTPGAETSIAAPKRRRVEKSAGGIAPMPIAAYAGMFNGQQLGAAAEQAVQQGNNRKKSQAQIDRRRERNRILARRTRLRKKFFFESIQKEIMELQRENEMLKDVVKVDIGGDEGKKILDSCDAAERMPPGVLEACREGGLGIDSQDFNLVKSIQVSQQSFIITDPSLTDNPIVYASDGFLELTGYDREQVLGRNCRFLQGTDTSKESVDEIRKALANGDDVSVTLLNYTADGTPFWNKLFIAALRDAQNNIVNFIGVVVKVASPEPGHPEHGKLSDGVKTDENVAESTISAMEDSVSAAAGHCD